MLCISLTSLIQTSMGKQNKREALKQAKIEAWEEGRRRDRERFEEEETSVRDEIKFHVEFESQSILLQQLQEYVDSSNELSISMSRHKELEKQQLLTQEKIENELSEIKASLKHTTGAKEVLEEKLRDVRIDHRHVKEVVCNRIDDLQKKLIKDINSVIHGVMEDVVDDRETAKQLCNREMENTRLAFLDLMREIRVSAEQFTAVLQDAKATHSNLPTRIRRQLQEMPTDQLLLVIDTLSFDYEVLQYFMFKFPPEEDLPYGILA